MFDSGFNVIYANSGMQVPYKFHVNKKESYELFVTL